ncbi:MAG: Tyrosine phenol-lyase [Anaerolineales bacterium]|nr:Tyrosine phenol-lyase [Anaerolineales bacterium]
MKTFLDVSKLSFRKSGVPLTPEQQMEILQKRMAGGAQALRPGDSLKDLEKFLAMRQPKDGTNILKPLPQHPAEPYRIKAVEIRGAVPTYETRRAAIEAAGYNTFLLNEKEKPVIYIDLLTDSGTSAMSDLQWAAMMKGNEDYAGSRSFYPLEETIRDVYGWKEVVPTHQGRGAEHLLSSVYIKPLLEQYPGDPIYVPKNMYFTTTKVHILKAGGTFVDIIIDEAHDPTVVHPFKGNVDLKKLQKLIDECIEKWGPEHGPRHIAYVHLEGCANMAGGQPFSMENLKAVRALTKKYGIVLTLDATRVIENAYFIQQREAGYGDKTVAQIVRQIGGLTDGCTMSSKKDHLVNIGGFLALDDSEKAAKARELLVDFEGFPTYGGMAGYSMEALSQGIREAVNDEWIAYRIGQTQYLGQLLQSADIPIVVPVGGHAVFIDARKFLAHIPQEQFPAQALAAALYLESGVRAMERGIASAGRDPKTGRNNTPKLELVRLTLPRRAYTQSHMDYVAEKVAALYAKRETIHGLDIEWEPAAGSLRFFLMRHKPIGGRLID